MENNDKNMASAITERDLTELQELCQGLNEDELSLIIKYIQSVKRSR